MKHFVAYHSREKMGFGYPVVRLGEEHSFFTRKKYRHETLLGNRLWAI